MTDNFAHDHHPTELLPWYVNGTLDETEKQSVEQHLAGCAACRDEVAFLRLLQEEASAPVDIPAPELMYRRFRRSLDAKPRRAPSRLARYAAVAASIVILVQAVAIFSLSRDDGDFRLAGQHGDGVLYQLRFQDSAEQGPVRSLLYSMNLRVVDGPTAMGIYTIRLDDEAVNSDAVLQRLEAHPDLIAYVKRN